MLVFVVLRLGFLNVIGNFVERDTRVSGEGCHACEVPMAPITISYLLTRQCCRYDRYNKEGRPPNSFVCRSQKSPVGKKAYWEQVFGFVCPS